MRATVSCAIDFNALLYIADIKLDKLSKTLLEDGRRADS